jgi:ABC-type multidrug transport system fused ATPase/permease subunit
VEAYTQAEANGTITGPAVNFISILSLTLVSMFGSLLFLQGKVTLGDLGSFVQYSRRFSGPINEMANIISELQSAASAAERVFRLLDEEEELPDVANAYSFENVRGAFCRSVLLHIYEDHSLGLFFRNHDRREFCEAYFPAREPLPAKQDACVAENISIKDGVLT